MSEISERLDLHDQIYGAILDKVRQDRYPSNQQLDLLEQHLVGHERQALVEALVDKIRQDRYPSMEMLRRVIRLSDTLR